MLDTSLRHKASATLRRFLRKAPKPVVDLTKRLAAGHPALENALGRLSPVRYGVHRIAEGPAKGMLMDVAGGGRSSYVQGTAEPEAVRFLREQIRPGDLVFDLGANVGYFTLIAAALTGPTGTVVAYEPIPDTAQILRRNVHLNALTNVEVVEAAISGQSGTAKIGIGATDQQASLVVPRDRGEITVHTASLDAEAARVGVPAIIKCDIEGAEYEAFAAAQTALADYPALLCEVHNVHNGDEGRFESLLYERGYSTEWLERGPWSSYLAAVRR